MGEVYRADDMKLDRQVAIKVLPEEMAGDGERLERFRREAKTLAAMNHPNIAAIYALESAPVVPEDGAESGESGSVEFLVMELIEGRTLGESIPPSGMDLDNLLEFSVPIADSLASAHSRGIVHRDLKPANVMVADEGRRVKVLDFGLAKVTSTSESDGHSELPTEAMTQEGMVLGTPHYMSPEQARGEVVDQRSDIFSLGIVLFEMATGTQPFQGQTAIELLSSVLRDTPSSICEIRPQLPRHLGGVVARCLEKDPQDRFQTAAEVHQALQSLANQGTDRVEVLEPPPVRPQYDADSTPTVAVSLTRRPEVFVGRSEERRRLDEMLGELPQGRGGLVLLGGAPGVGKTRLAIETLEVARQSGLLAMTGHAYEDEPAPLVLASEILEEMLRVLPQADLPRLLGDSAGELSRLLPEIRQRYPDTPEPLDLPPELQQRHFFKSVLEFLTRVSRDTPLVLLLDDLHWADESSLQLLRHIAPHLSELPVLMIGTYRDVEADIGKPFARSMATLVRQRQAEQLLVNAFDEESTRELLSALGGAEAPRSLASAIFRATEGNVFFVEETFRHLSEEGQLQNDDGQWRPDIDIENLDVPGGVRLVTERRIERLTDDTQSVLTFAAVLGLRFPVLLLEQVAGDPDVVLSAIEEAESAHLLRPATGGRELRYEFVHALSRQTVLTDLSVLRRQRMHLSIAEVIEKLAEKSDRLAADVAHHLVEAGSLADSSRTARWLARAGTSSAAAAAMQEAVEYYDAALSLLDSEEREARARLLHRRGSARLSLGRREEFVEDLTGAFEMLEELGLGADAAAVLSELSYVLIWDAQPAEAQALITRGLKLVGEEASASHSRLLSARGLAHGMAQELVEARENHMAAVGMARSLDIAELLAETLQHQAIDWWFQLNGSTQEQVAHEAAALRRELGQEWNLGHCLWMEQAGLTWQGRYAEAEVINEELIPLAERNEDMGSLAICAMMNCLIEQARGNLESSSAHMRRSKDLFEAGGFPWGWISEGHFSVNALLMGEDEAARTAFELAGENAIPGVVWSGADNCYLLSGKAWLGDDDTWEVFERLRQEIPAAGSPKSSGPAMLLMGAIEALVLIGREDEAAQLYPAIQEIVAEEVGVQSFTYGFHQRFAGIAAAAAGDWTAAEQHLATALEMAEELEHRVEQARVRYWYARMLLARGGDGDPGRAGDLLDEARTLCQSMGLAGLRKKIDSLG
jgi:serine/threonine protein kinase/tetratricopeptide (TPR) repeat protein